jgi:tetrapyrrole methylase family protein/MazG family protein
LAGASDSKVGELTPATLAAGAHLIPALDEQANLASPHGLPWLVARLRAPDGCPWDREQTHLSLRKFLLEEAYEVYDALEEGSTPALAGELGDLLLQVVLHAHYAAEDGVFDLSDVYSAVMTKIIRRHPHVFGDVDARTVDDVVRNWERIKADERAAATDGFADELAYDRAETGANGRSRSEIPDAFRGLSRSLPALSYSQEIQERAASLGYDWPAIEPVMEKLEEELAELRDAENGERRREEFGDLLLVIVNLGRKLGIDTEAALRSANAKFARRFAEVERLAAARDVRLNELSFDELDELWQRAKQAGRAS